MKIKIIVPDYCLSQLELDYPEYPVPAVGCSIRAFTRNESKETTVTVNSVLFDYLNNTITVYAGVIK